LLRSLEVLNNGKGERSRTGLIKTLGGEIRCGHRNAHSVGGVNWQVVAGLWVAVEHEHPVIVELEFWSLPDRLYTTPPFGWWCLGLVGSASL
jgi:hypothetical protein